MVALGPPLRTQYKEDERMTIHSTSNASESGMESECNENCFLFSMTPQTRYTPDFYNYFQHGLDFLISGSSHLVRKIIIHSNVVGSVHLSFWPTSDKFKAWFGIVPKVQAL
jgi:hypothetical protein